MAKPVKLIKLEGTVEELAQIIRDSRITETFVFKKDRSRVYTYVCGKI
jgi:hypothetical protein